MYVLPPVKAVADVARKSPSPNALSPNDLPTLEEYAPPVVPSMFSLLKKVPSNVVASTS
jgi:hypothetical protein